MTGLLKNRKAKMEISILLLVILTLILVIFSVFVFNTRTGDYKKTLGSSQAMDELYSSAAIFEFNVRHIVEDVAKNNKISSEKDFMANFIPEFHRRLILNEQMYSPYEYGLYVKFNNLLGDNQNYEVKIKENTLMFNMKDFKFSETLADNSAEMSSIEYVKDVAFQISLK